MEEYDKLIKELDEIDSRLFMIDMIDRWTEEDSKSYERLLEQKQDILNKIGKTKKEVKTTDGKDKNN